jgi:hypothetical protein
MLDKDKLWIICYLNISNIDGSDIPKFVQEMKHDCLTFDESVKVIIVPSRNTETYFEFYNMSKIEPSTLDELNEKLKNFN